MIQNGIVYLIIVVALVGAIRFCYRKLKALKKDESCSTCDTCPLKDSCARKPVKKGHSVNTIKSAN
ncbi:MAG: FeoB-associated Cys-rich membrane protein [Odoribacter sp.]|nr:FeoB-associated Cys-rich membrane protein [Odoribacter sp.]